MVAPTQAENDRIEYLKGKRISVFNAGLGHYFHIEADCLYEIMMCPMDLPIFTIFTYPTISWWLQSNNNWENSG